MKSHAPRPSGQLVWAISAVAFALVVPAWWINPAWLRYVYVAVVAAAYVAAAMYTSRR